MSLLCANELRYGDRYPQNLLRYAPLRNASEMGSQYHKSRDPHSYGEHSNQRLRWADVSQPRLDKTAQCRWTEQFQCLL